MRGSLANERTSRSHRLRQPPDGQNSYVVFLTEGLRRVGNVEGGLPAQIVHAVKAEKLSGRLPGFDDAVYATLIKSKNADAYFYTRETTQDAPDFYSADASLNGAKITERTPLRSGDRITAGHLIMIYDGAGLRAAKPVVIFDTREDTEEQTSSGP